MLCSEGKGGGRRLVWSAGVAAAAGQGRGGPSGGERPASPSLPRDVAGAAFGPGSGRHRGHVSPLQQNLHGSIPEVQPQEAPEHPRGPEAVLVPVLPPPHQPEVQHAAAPPRLPPPPIPRAAPARPGGAPTAPGRPLGKQPQRQLHVLSLWPRSRAVLRSFISRAMLVKQCGTGCRWSLAWLGPPQQHGGGEGSDWAAGRACVQCPVCGRQFQGTKRNYLLNRHFQIHTGEKPYQCPHCSHRANRKSNLKMHIESRHGSQALFYSRTPDESSASQDTAGLGFLSESLASPQDTQAEQQLSGGIHKAAAGRRDCAQGHVPYKMTTRSQDAGAAPLRHAARQKVGLSDQAQEDLTDDSPFSPFSEFMNVREEAVSVESGHDGYSHQP